MECNDITVQELKQKLFAYDDIQLVDVREVDEYRSGHIEGSVLIPLGALPHLLHRIDERKEIVVVCRSGNRSSEACKILRDRGFREVKSLRGGLSSWSA